MPEGILNHTWLTKQLDLIRAGINFPLNSIKGILLTNVTKEKIEVNENKEKVLDFIKEKKKVYLSEISRKFNFDVVETKLILNELENEGKIKINE